MYRPIAQFETLLHSMKEMCTHLEDHIKLLKEHKSKGPSNIKAELALLAIRLETYIRGAELTVLRARKPAPLGVG